MKNQLAEPAPSARAGRHRVFLATLAVILVVLVAAGLFAYLRLTAGTGHHSGDTIVHMMPGGGTVAITLESATVLPGNAPASPGMQPYAARVRVVNHTSGLLNITSAQFTAGQRVSGSDQYPPTASCSQDISPGASLECDLRFSLPQNISHPVLYWLPDGASNTADVWWYLTA